MKRFLSIFAALTLAMGLVACQPGQNVPGATAAGAVAGGVLGSTLFHGSTKTAAIIGSALVGGIVGNRIGQAMDRQDRANMEGAIQTVPVNKTATWTNDQRDVTYQVTPTKEYTSGNRYCREYRTRVNINGEWQTAYGRACRMPDGTWRVVQ